MMRMRLDGEDLREHTSAAAGSEVKKGYALWQLWVMRQSMKDWRWPLYGEVSLSSN